MAIIHPAFPNTNNEPFTATSPKDPSYNCIGWAFGGKRKMWPNSRTYYWPPNVPNAVHINSFVELFKTQGYEVCDNGDLEKDMAADFKSFRFLYVDVHEEK